MICTSNILYMIGDFADVAVAIVFNVLITAAIIFDL
jgi:hypothetical protein